MATDSGWEEILAGDSDEAIVDALRQILGTESVTGLTVLVVALSGSSDDEVPHVVGGGSGDGGHAQPVGRLAADPNAGVGSRRRDLLLVSDDAWPDRDGSGRRRRCVGNLFA